MVQITRQSIQTRPTALHRPPEPLKKKRFAKFSVAKPEWLSKKVLLIFSVVFLVLLSALFGYLYTKTRDELSRAQNPEAAAKAEAEELSKKVGVFLELPKDESPTIATVSDAEKLNDQVFFQYAQNGDKVLVYTTAHKAVLYRPSTNKVIEYAPVAVGQQQ